MRTPETERILYPVKLEEDQIEIGMFKGQVVLLFYFVLFFPQFRITSYTMTLPEKALQEEGELFKRKTYAELLFPWLIMYSYAQKLSYCNISMIFVIFFSFFDSLYISV